MNLILSLFTAGKSWLPVFDKGATSKKAYKPDKRFLGQQMALPYFCELVLSESENRTNVPWNTYGFCNWCEECLMKYTLVSMEPLKIVGHILWWPHWLIEFLASIEIESVVTTNFPWLYRLGKRIYWCPGTDLFERGERETRISSACMNTILVRVWGKSMHCFRFTEVFLITSYLRIITDQF